MKNTKRQAFTIVELVIVIAVIAILSAVLIPTFGSIIKNANIAADQSAASTLTSELQVFLKGETIDSEEELMAALDESGVGVKLVPKALAYGYHFWFDMKTQTIFAAHPDEVEDMEPAKVTASAEQDGPALMADVQPLADETTYANVGIRDVFDKGYFLITNCGDSDPLTKALSLVENLNSAEQYKQLIDLLNKASSDVDNPTAINILNKIKDTTIRTQNGVFFYGGSSVYEHISSSAETLSGPYYNYNPNSQAVESASAAPNPTGGTAIKLPSNIKLVLGNGMNYELAEGATNATTTIVMPSVESVVNAFAPASTNALISINGENHIVTTTANCTTAGHEDKETCDVLVNINDAENPVIVAHLEIKLPYANYVIKYVEADTGKATDVTLNENGKIYVAQRNGYLQLVAANADNPEETSNRVEKWEVVAGDYGTVEIDEKSGLIDLTTANAIKMENGKYVCEVTVKATANTAGGSGVTKNITIVVICPVTATLTLGDHTIGFTGTSSTPELTFKKGADNSFKLGVNGITYSGDKDGNNPLALTPKFEISKLNGFVYDDESGTLKFQINAADGSLVETANFSFTASVDGYFTKTVSVEVKDESDSAVSFNYRQNYQAGRPNYYIGALEDIEKIGTNKVYLSDLFELDMDRLKDTDTLKVTIYGDKESSGYLSIRNEINKLNDANPNLYTLSAEYDPTVEVSDWAEATVEFIGTKNIGNIYIEITPPDGNATAVHIEIANGAINLDKRSDDIIAVYDAEDATKLLYYALDVDDYAWGNVVLHSDITVLTGTTITVGEKETFYGNGYVIDAREYVATETIAKSSIEVSVTSYFYCSHSSCQKKVSSSHYTDYWKHSLAGNISVKNTKSYSNVYAEGNYYLIKLEDGGKIDNIYVDGPVYPQLQYGMNEGTTKDDTKKYADTPYYVSGILTTGTATVANSYVSGFRQPIKVNDGELTVDNTTLYGGNYANLLLAQGSLILTDVTTVQPETGIPSTVDTENVGSKNVVGLGIVAENANSNITLNGYLDQYNWISYDTTATLPTVTIDGVNLKFDIVLAALFHGVRVDIDVPLTSDDIFKEEPINFIEQFIEKIGTKEYLNTGIIFMDIGIGSSAASSFADINTKDADGNNKESSFTVADNREQSEYVNKTQITGSLPFLFSTKDIITSLGINADKLVRALEYFSVVDGWAYANLDYGIVTELSNPIDACIKVWSYDLPLIDQLDEDGNVVKDDNGNPIKINALGSEKYPINWEGGYYYNNSYYPKHIPSTTD